ncbi:MerR family transcriptional regulator [Hymenobacter guriensis]|uniref:DNA-binding protein n=1 Tax=Hymenobacter guriensis TaxID=2793065 RepID=A0ABS0L7R0_9BACT|nr:hypothetical protein [Hymenobacter guriensis]MBG8556186.1 hypothetical protein [Hymenobacter guriensis]
MPAFQEQMQAWLEAQPQPDPQYTVLQVAEILNLDESTIRNYFTLPATHPLALPWVPCTDSAKGRRVLLSDLTAWQQRNRRTNQVIPLTEDKRPARRGALPKRRSAV